MSRLSLLGVAPILLLLVPATAAEYRVEPLKEGPPKDEISAELAAALDSSGIRVLRGEKAPYCEIWLCNQLEIAADAKRPPTAHYPFRSGQLIGVVRYARSGADFREQKISKGIYTLRYALMPTDGAHEGVFPTRDFLLLVHAAKDRSLADIKDLEALQELSAQAVESSHPGILCLRQVAGDAKASLSIRHDEGADWWILRFPWKAKTSSAVQEKEAELVVFGHVKE